MSGMVSKLTISTNLNSRPANKTFHLGSFAALNKDEVALGEFAAKLALDKSATSRRLRDATDRRHLVNL